MANWKRVSIKFPTVKLGQFIDPIKKNFAEESDEAYNTVYGVSNIEGITITGKAASKDISKYIILEKDCFVYNPYRVNIGSIGMNKANLKGCVSPAYVVFKTKTGLNPEFLYHYLKSDFGNHLINWYGNRGGVRDALRFDALCEIDIPQLSLDQQNRLLQRIDSNKDLLDLLNHECDSQYSHLTLLFQSVLQDAIEGKLTEVWRKKNPVRKGDPESDATALLEKIKKDKQRLIGEGKIKKEKPFEAIKSEELAFELPEGWVWARLGEVSDIAGGLQKTPLRAPKKEFYPYLAVQNVQRGYLKINEYEFFEASKGEVEKLRLQKADLLLIEGNGSINEIGRCAIWNNEIADCIHQNHVIRARMINLEMPFFIIKVLNSQFGISQMQNKARTTTGLFNLGVGKLSEVLIPLPPLREQRAIVEQVDRLLAVVDALKEQVAKRKVQVEELMQTVFREAFES